MVKKKQSKKYRDLFQYLTNQELIEKGYVKALIPRTLKKDPETGKKVLSNKTWSDLKSDKLTNELILKDQSPYLIFNGVNDKWESGDPILVCIDIDDERLSDKFIKDHSKISTNSAGSLSFSEKLHIYVLVKYFKDIEDLNLKNVYYKKDNPEKENKSVEIFYSAIKHLVLEPNLAQPNTNVIWDNLKTPITKADFLNIFKILGVSYDYGKVKTYTKDFNHENINYTGDNTRDLSILLNLTPNEKGIVNCPFHNDTHPSAVLNDKKELLTCFTCDNEFKANKKGTAILDKNNNVVIDFKEKVNNANTEEKAKIDYSKLNIAEIKQLFDELESRLNKLGWDQLLKELKETILEIKATEEEIKSHNFKLKCEKNKKEKFILHEKIKDLENQKTYEERKQDIIVKIIMKQHFKNIKCWGTKTNVSVIHIITPKNRILLNDCGDIYQNLNEIIFGEFYFTNTRWDKIFRNNYTIFGKYSEEKFIDVIQYNEDYYDVSFEKITEFQINQLYRIIKVIDDTQIKSIKSLKKHIPKLTEMFSTFKLDIETVSFDGVTINKTLFDLLITLRDIKYSYPHILVNLIGKPGSGKGSFIKLLEKECNVGSISKPTELRPVGGHNESLYNAIFKISTITNDIIAIEDFTERLHQAGESALNTFLSTDTITVSSKGEKAIGTFNRGSIIINSQEPLKTNTQTGIQRRLIHFILNPENAKYNPDFIINITKNNIYNEIKISVLEEALKYLWNNHRTTTPIESIIDVEANIKYINEVNSIETADKVLEFLETHYEIDFTIETVNKEAYEIPKYGLELAELSADYEKIPNIRIEKANYIKTGNKLLSWLITEYFEEETDSVLYKFLIDKFNQHRDIMNDNNTNPNQYIVKYFNELLEVEGFEKEKELKENIKRRIQINGKRAWRLPFWKQKHK